jgi:hypothetical protein
VDASLPGLGTGWWGDVKRTPIRAVSAKRRAENRVRRAAELALYEASPFCALCGKSGIELHGHERLGRAQGGDPTKPDVLLCNSCNTLCEDQPRIAALNGWKISRKWSPGGAA